jgi:hypothetical protein
LTAAGRRRPAAVKGRATSGFWSAAELNRKQALVQVVVGIEQGGDAHRRVL